MRYKLLLEGKEIGETNLEHGDPPMGAAFGKILFNEIQSPYEYLTAYCIRNNIELVIHSPQDKLIATGHMENLEIINEIGQVIKGEGGISIEGMGKEFSVQILGIDSEIYSKEFSALWKDYFG